MIKKTHILICHDKWLYKALKIVRLDVIEFGKNFWYKSSKIIFILEF